MPARKMPKRAVLDSAFARIVKNRFYNPQMSLKESARKLMLPSDVIAQNIALAAKSGYPVKPAEFSRGTERLAEKNAERAAGLLKNTAMRNSEIARLLKVPESRIARFSELSQPRSAIISRAIARGRGLDWRRLPKLAKVNANEKLNALVEFLKKFDANSRKIKHSEYMKLREKLAVEILDSLDHYTPELCGAGLYVFLVAQRHLMLSKNAGRIDIEALKPLG